MTSHRGRTALTAALVAGLVLATIAALTWFVVIPNYRPPLRAGESYGLDVSRHQGKIDWPAVRHDGIRFAYLKASEGGDDTDRFFERNAAGAKAAGLRIGAYHFFTFCRSGADQAANFLAVVGDRLDLPPAIDLEYAGNCSKRPAPAALYRQVDDFIRIVEEALDTTVILYVLDDTEHDYDVRKRSEAPLWSRRYPLRPSRKRSVIWQLHGFAHVDGVRGSVDLNVANITKLTGLARSDRSGR